MARIIPLLLLIFSFLSLSAQHNTQAQYRLRGKVLDSYGELLVGVYIKVSPGDKMAVTDTSGTFSFVLPEGAYQLEATYLSMKPNRQEILLQENTGVTLLMEYSDVSLEQVMVVAKPSMDVNSVNMGSTYMDIQTLRKLPPLLGEVDVVRSITTLPGVVSAGEGSAGFYVRGGSADQNLILLDDAPVFNSAHLFGFYSVYNPDILSGYLLHRSGISAKYGSRISSILDVKLRNGNPDKMQYHAGISPVAAKIGLDGPIGSKTTFLLAARGAYPDYILKMFPNEDINQSSGYFYDLNLKAKHTFNENNNLELSSYYSQDGFSFPYDTAYSWSNLLGSLKWNHIYSSRFSSVVTLAKSVYDNNVEGFATGENFILNSGINYSQLKADFSYSSVNKQLIEFGAGLADYQIQAGRLQTFENSSLNPIRLQKDNGTEFFSYLNDEITFSKKLSLALGLRYSFFLKKGPSEVFIYEEGLPKSPETIIDTLSYAAGRAAEQYQGPEPRASIKYSLGNNSSLKAGYSRTRQYIQLISNTAAITPVDVWKLSNRYIKPQIADQYSLGFFYVQQDRRVYEFSWEVYYKKLFNQLDYKDGAKILLNPTLEADLLYGEGSAYGSEWLIKKNAGTLTGWLSVAYARSFRTIAGSTKEETINNGLKYPSNFDKPLNLNLFVSYPFPSSNWSFSTNFNYSTGRPITASDSWYRYYGKIFANYSGRNQERMPDYHRLDIAFNYNSPAKKKIQTSWSISVYNLYGRKNAYSTLFRHVHASPPGAYKLAIIGIPIPSLSFNVKF